MKNFLSKIILFLLPLLILFAVLMVLYFYFDPFKVLRSYDDYSNSHIIPNRDYISTEVFNKNYKAQHYNSFIFGSSRSLAFKPSAWSQYLESTDKPFSFDASGESVYGIYTKLKYLDSLNVPVKNALIVLCRDVSFLHDKNHEGFLFIKHPATSGESRLSFQLQFFKAYFDPKFLYNFYAYKIIGGYRPFMKGIIEDRTITMDPVTNEAHIVDQEKALANNPEAYYKQRKDMFYSRSDYHIDSVRRINDKHLFMLKEIKRILEKNHSNYRVVISPLYEQIKLHPADETILKGLFSPYIYDFSGKNYFTEPLTNYYETSHYRKEVADSIMHVIYKKQVFFLP